MEQSPFQELSFKANFFVGANAQGGNLYIYDDTFVFKPHSANFGNLSEKVIQIRDICGYKKGFLTTMFIYLNNGLEIKLAVWQKDDIIKALEERRHAIFRNAGEEIPQLKRF